MFDIMHSYGFGKTITLDGVEWLIVVENLGANYTKFGTRYHLVAKGTDTFPCQTYLIQEVRPEAEAEVTDD